MISLATTAAAQSFSRFSIDSAVAIDYFQGQNSVDRPNIVVDVSGVVRLGGGWLAYIRPWFRQPRTPAWDKQIYQAAVQYERNASIATRVDLGYIVSPIGIGMMDTRPGVNPTISPHLSYLTPMPVFDPQAPRVPPIAATYPLGAQATFSRTKWDARVAMIATPPNRVYVINPATPNPPMRPIVVAGAGYTPKTGLRLGAGVAAGDYVKGSELRRPEEHGRGMTLVTVEGEYAFGYSKFTGEVTRDALETGTGTEAAYAWFIQGIHTLSPRWFVAGRQEGTDAPPLRTGIIVSPRYTFHTTEATAGFRLTPEFTLRGSFYARKAFTRSDWDQQGGVSLVWAHRWW